MCVIMFIDDVRPTPYMVQKAWERNDDGGGVAYRVKTKGGMEVAWKKGLEGAEGLVEMQHLIKTLPLPFIAHFRVASCGGIRQELCHPFPIDKSTSLDLEGRTKGYVLFHNGDWKGWAETCRTASIMSNTPTPRGRWSDTRALAFLSGIYGPWFMEFFPDQRGIAYGPEDMEIFTGNGWTKINDVWCSNDLFMTKVVSPTMCRFPTCARKDIDHQFYCPMHTSGFLQPLNPRLVSDKKNESGGTLPEVPLSQGLITLTRAKALNETKDRHGNKLLSKNLLKKIRKLYEKLSDEKNKNRAYALVELSKITQKLQSTGSAH